MTEEQYRDLDYCICRYNCFFGSKRPHIDRGVVLSKLLQPIRGGDGKILMNKFINLIQSKQKP